jgi:23S rRNA pseudouridine1911/1915/1917 synthase
MTFYPTLVNRLDVLTSGVVILATTLIVQKAMQDLIGRRLISREYVALVEGTLPENKGTIDFPIGPHAASEVRMKMACRSDGKESVTAYSVIERLPGHTLLCVTPLSGRQHQIRVHLAAIGHPIRGDLLYKNETLFLTVQPAVAGAKNASPSARHFLHARRASFIHPVSGVQIDVEAPTPEDFHLILKQLRRDCHPSR